MQHMITEFACGIPTLSSATISLWVMAAFVCVEWVVRRVLPLWISLSQRGLVAIFSDLVEMSSWVFSEKVVV